MLFPFVLPLADIAFLTPPPRSTWATEPLLSQPWLLAFLLLVAVVILIGLRPRNRPRRRRKQPSRRRKADLPKHFILVDGSNVMHWKDGKPQIATVQSVVKMLKARGFSPGVVFDANAGYKLGGRYINDKEFASVLTLPRDQVFVVPKGKQADPFLLGAARDYGARVVSMDRFRDWAEDHPEVKQPGFLIRGGYRSTGELWLDEAFPAAVNEPA